MSTTGTTSTKPLTNEEVQAQLAELARMSAEVDRLLGNVGMSREKMRDKAHKSGLHRVGAMFRRLEAGDDFHFFEPKPPRKIARRKMRL